jgi:hypothetical protein
MAQIIKVWVDNTNTTTKCVLVHYGFHYILSEFGHFYLI